MQNRKTFNEVVHGVFGRKILTAPVEVVTKENIVKIIGDCIGDFYFNKTAAAYLWRYWKGDQPILYRTKKVRSDVNNRVVENHAYEIVEFKVGQTYGEPLQCVSIEKENEDIGKYVDNLNRYLKLSNKHERNIRCGEWQSATGTGFIAANFNRKKNRTCPFRLTIPTPLNTFIIYSSITEEPLVAVQELEDIDGNSYKMCYTDTHQCRIVNSNVLDWRVHAFGDIPIVEYPNNSERLSDIELVTTMFDSINLFQSDRINGLAQFIQSFIKFVNCEIDNETYAKMKEQGAFVVKSNNGDNKADVDIMSQELNQSESQVAKKDMLESILQILAIPKLEGNTGGDTQGAVSLRNGWDMAKSRTKLKDPTVQESEKRLLRVILNIIRVEDGADKCPIDIGQFDVIINHSPMDNMLVKAQFLDYLLKDGVYPKLAFELSTLFPDSEKAYAVSKPYLDALYSTREENEPDTKKTSSMVDLLVKLLNAGASVEDAIKMSGINLDKNSENLKKWDYQPEDSGGGDE